MIQSTLRLIVLCIATAMIFPIAAAAETDLGVKIFDTVSGGILGVTAQDKRHNITKSGTGVAIGNKAVLTNCHIITTSAGGKEVVLPDIKVHQPANKIRPRRSFAMKAELLEDIGDQDMCILFVEDLSNPPAATVVPLGSVVDVAVGEKICGIGNPMGHNLSIACGVVSQLRSCQDLQEADFDVPCGETPDLIVQTDIDASPGFSGGGVFGKNGLIGIMTFRRWEKRGANGLAIPAGPAFVLPVEWVRRSHVYSRLLHKRVRERTKIGAFDRAKEFAQEIYHARRRALALLHIADRQLKAGDVPGALDTLDRVLPAVNEAYVGGHSHSGHVGLLIRIAMLHWKAGSVQEARGLLNDAFRVTEEAYNEHEEDRHRYNHDDHAKLLAKIARARLKVGDPSEARLLLDQAFEAAKRTKLVGAASRAERFRDIACTQIKLGDSVGETKKAFEDAIRAARPGRKADRIRQRMSRCGA